MLKFIETKTNDGRLSNIWNYVIYLLWSHLGRSHYFQCFAFRFWFKRWKFRPILRMSWVGRLAQMIKTIQFALQRACCCNRFVIKTLVFLVRDLAIFIVVGTFIIAVSDGHWRHTLELIAFSNGLTDTKNLNQILNLFPEHFWFVRVSLFIETTYFSSVYLLVLDEGFCDKMALIFRNFFLSLRQIKINALRFMVVL